MQAKDLPGSDIDLMRDVYMTNTQRAAYERIRAIAEASEGLRADAMRYAYLRGKAKQNTAYDVFGNGGHWQIGLHSNDNRLSLDAAIDSAMAGAVTQGEG